MLRNCQVTLLLHNGARDGWSEGEGCRGGRGLEFVDLRKALHKYSPGSGAARAAHDWEDDDTAHQGGMELLVEKMGNGRMARKCWQKDFKLKAIVIKPSEAGVEINMGPAVNAASQPAIGHNV